MIKMPDTKGKFFSVKYSTKIQGVHYTPSVCYPLSQGLEAVIEEMAAKDMAKIYPEKVRFVTGIPYPVKKPEAGTTAPRSSSVSALGVKIAGAVKQPPKKASAASEKQQGRKLGRNTDASQANREFD